MKDFFKFPKTKTLLWTLCSILVVLVAFGLGVAVGYRRAVFASGLSENYYHNFYSMAAGRGFFLNGIGYGAAQPFNPHGVTGEVVDIGSSTLAIQDADGETQSVLVASATPIREMNGPVLFAAIQVGDRVTVIGEPNDSGQVEARFIRVFTPSYSQP